MLDAAGHPPPEHCGRDHESRYKLNSQGRWVCAECQRENTAAYRARNPKPKKPRPRRTDGPIITCRVCGTPKSRDDYAPSRLTKNDPICRSCGSEEAKAWKQANRDKMLAAGLIWRDAHRDELREYDLDRYWSDPDTHRERVRIRMATPEGRSKRALWQQLRNARTAGVEGNDLTDEEWQLLVALCDGRCLACGRADQPLTRDHIVPLSRAGALTLGNVQPLCGPCNSRKGCAETDYRPVEVIQLIQQATRREAA